MKIKGVVLEKADNVTVCIIEKFSIGLQALITKQLRGIYHGEAEMSIYDYKITLKSFFQRYDSQSAKTQKGMIGELLAHLIIKNTQYNFLPISIYKNKEESSIKKGFDIIYFEKTKNKIWFCEVKSGNKVRSVSGSEANTLNLLRRASAGISRLVVTKKISVWESALSDVTATVSTLTKKTKIKELLSNQSTVKQYTGQHNVILTSVLFSALSDRIDAKRLATFLAKTTKKNAFSEVLIFSIQKETYSKVIKFLKQEAKK